MTKNKAIKTENKIVVSFAIIEMPLCFNTAKVQTIAIASKIQIEMKCDF